jgi:peptide/nickel transport system substrate-binding protein
MLLTRRLLLGTAAAAAATSLWAPHVRAAAPDTLRFASAAGGPRMTDPNQTTQGSDNWAVIQMFEYLVQPPDGNFGIAPEDFQPWLAESWTTSDDAKTWVFTLRQGVQFHKGYGEMTADDVTRSFLRARDEGVSKANYTNLADVTSSGKYEVTITLTNPDPMFLSSTVTSRNVMVVSAKAEAELGEKFQTEPIGTGPYKIEQWDAGQKITLSTWDGYWGDKPAYAKAEYQWRSESSVRAAMVTSGEADVAMGLSPDDNIGDLGVDYPNNETVALRLDANAAPLNDIRVRQAINYAIDKEGIVNSLYQGKHKVAAQLVPEGVVGHNSALTGWPFDLDKAKSLVAEAKADGVDTSKQISLVVRSAQFPKITELGQVLQEQLGQAGLNVKLKMLETSQHLTYQVRPFPKDEGAVALMTQHGNQAGDAAFTVDQYMLSTGAQSYFGTPEFDAMIKKADAASGDGRKKDFEEIFAYQNDKVVQFAHISHQTGIIGKAKSVNYTPNSSSGDELRVSEMTPAS